MNRLLIGLWVLVFAVGTVAVVKNMGAGSTGGGSAPRAASASRSARPPPPPPPPLGSQPNATTTVTVHTALTFWAHNK
jgi:hypothetical protein